MTRPTLTDWPITTVATLTACAGGVWLGWQLRGVVPASARKSAITTRRADVAPRVLPRPDELAERRAATERPWVCDFRSVHEPHIVWPNGVARKCAGIEIPYYLNKPDSHKTLLELTTDAIARAEEGES